MSSIRQMVMALVGVAAVAFLGGIVAAGYYTLWAPGAPEPDAMPAFLTMVVTSTSAVLATNFGAVVGVRAVVGHFHLAERDMAEKLRVWAAWFYLVGLVLAVGLWALAGFPEESTDVVPLLPELSKSLAGIIAGALAVALGVPPEGEREGSVG